MSKDTESPDYAFNMAKNALSAADWAIQEQFGKGFGSDELFKTRRDQSARLAAALIIASAHDMDLRRNLIRG